MVTCLSRNTSSVVIQTMEDTEIAAKLAMTDTDFVKPAKPVPPQVVALSPADQIMTDEYICYLMLFPFSTSSDNQAVYSGLKAGLSLTLSEIPSIGGYLTRDEGAAGERLQITIDENPGVRLIYRNLTTPDSQTRFKYSYHELKQDNFPCSAFDQEITMPVPFSVTKPDPAVMAIQTNFIHGGLILSICVHHKACDALALSAVLKTWAKHTAVANMANGNGFQAAIDRLIPRSMSRAPMCNGLVGAQLKDFPEYRVLDDRNAMSPARSELVAAAAAPATSPSRLKSPLGPLKLCIFSISASRLADLKSAASPSTLSDGWISTNDALCAFIWRHITRARGHVASILQPNSSSPQGPLNFALAVEARRRMVPALPAEYLGNAAFHCPVTSDLTTVASPSTPLSSVAMLIRKAVSGFNSAKMRGILGLTDSMHKASDLLICVYDEPMRGLVVSSWADIGLYELEWGPELGKVESVRVPNLTLDGGTPLCGVFPRMPDGGLEILICLEEPAIQALRGDEEFLAFAEWKCM